MADKIRVGVHRHNWSLLVLSKTGYLERRLEDRAEVEWVTLPIGQRTPDYMAAGLIDIGGTGVTPPILGQALGIRLFYFALSRRQGIGGILVREKSDIRKVADLAGRTVSLAIGSGLQNLLLFALHRHGLKWTDIVPLDLQDADARRALSNGGLDAWVTAGFGDVPKGFRYLDLGCDPAANPSVFYARAVFAEAHEELLDAVIKSLNDAGVWIAGNLSEAANLFARELGGTAKSWQKQLKGRDWRVELISEAFLAEQQAAADLYHRSGLLQRPVNIREALPKPAKPARRRAMP